MSELEEPPAKVLKIDTIDGITHMTEVSDFPEPFDGVVEEEIMGEESGIIEGGADPGQEEWLSEGILTDDDYNPQSQETIDDHTDSQLGTGDEEHLDSTLDSETNVAESEAHLVENGAHLAESEEHLGDSEEHLDDSGEQLAESEAHLTESEEHLDDSGAQLAGNEVHLTESEEHLEESEEHLAENEVHLRESDEQLDDSGAHLSDNEAHLADNGVHLADNEGHLDDNEGHLAESEKHLAESVEHLAENEAHLAENEAHLAENEAHLAENEEHLAGSDKHFVQSDTHLAESVTHFAENETNGINTEPNLTETEQLLPENVTNLAESKVHMPESEVTAENEDNIMEIDDNVNLKNRTHTTESESDITMTESNLGQSDTNITNNEENMSQTVEQLMDVDNIMESQTYTQEYTVKLKSNVINVGSPTDIVIQRVMLNKNPNVKEIEAKTVELNIEETMKHLDGEKDDLKSNDYERFLNKSTAGRSEPKVKAEVKEEVDDGNDTDDLLRMLSEGDSKGKKRLTKTVKNIRAGASSDEDDFVYEGSSAGLQSLKAAKSALAKKQALTAEPEDMEDGDDETEMSGDESKTVQKMFGYNSKSMVTRRPQKAASPRPAARRPPTILNVIERPREVKPPTRQYQNKRQLTPRAQSILKPTTAPPRAAAKTPAHQMEAKTSFRPPEVKAPAPFKSAVTLQTIDKKPNRRAEPVKTRIEPAKSKFEPGKTQSGKMTQLGKKIEQAKVKFDLGKVKVGSGKITIEPGKMMPEPDEIINEEEFLDEDEFGLDEDEFAESDIETSHHRQRIMRPEMMDEEVPSDGESASEDGSLYDELPSSDSEDMDDWFTLDIRSEKAGDYLPLLGPKAKELLMEEKRRVSARLSTLKQSHTALIASGKQQAATLRRATASLAELDDMLRAA